MTTYAVYGTTLQSDESFPELPVSDGRGRWRFSRGPLVPPDAASWISHWRLRDGGPWLKVATMDDAFCFAFADTADFRADPVHGTIVNLIDDGPERTVRHLLLDQVLPLLLSLESLVLHASGVSVDGRAVAFVGPAGAGKSTLALALSRFGVPVLADDALVIREHDGVLTAFPSYPGLRLWPDALGAREREASIPVAAYSAKKRLVTGVPFERHPLPLADVYVMRRAPVREPSAARLHAASFLALLLSQAFHLPAGRASHREHFDRLFDAGRRTRGWTLTLPHDPSDVGVVAEYVLNHSRRDSRMVQ